MTEFDPVEFGRSIGAMIREAVEPLKSENAELRKEIEALKEREHGRIEDQAVEIDVSDVVKELLASDGIKQLVGLEVESFLTENPPADGKDGAGIADLLIDRDGNLVATFTDGRMKSLGVVVGKDGAPGRDGKDLSALSAEFDDTGLTIHTAAGAIRKEFELPHDGGYWSENNRTHRKGAIVTHNGIAFIAKRATTAEPKTEENDDWRILARKGRDGKDGRNGIDKTAPVKVKRGDE
jgi:hypothetical protein